MAVRQPRRRITRTRGVSASARTRASILRQGRDSESVKRSISSFAKDLVNNISNLKDLNVQSIYNSNVSKIPNQYRNTFLSLISNEANRIKAEQNNKILGIEASIKSAKSNMDSAERSFTKDFTAEARARYDLYLLQGGELKRIKKSLEDGVRYDASVKELREFAFNKALPSYQSTLNAMRRFEVKLDNRKINEYITSNFDTNTLKTPSQVKSDLKKFNITTQQAKLISSNLKSSIQSKPKTSSVRVTPTTKTQEQILKNVMNSFDLSRYSGVIKDFSNVKIGSRFIEALDRKGDISAAKYKEYQKLSPENKRAVNNYNLILSLQKEIEPLEVKRVLAKQKDVINIRNISEFVSSPKEVIVLVNKALDKGLKIKDFATLLDFKKESKQNIQSNVSKNTLSKYNKILKSYNTYVNASNDLDVINTLKITDIYKKALIKDFRSIGRKELGSLLISPSLFALNNVKDITRVITLWGKSRVLKERI